jgi:hypothetical protein
MMRGVLTLFSIYQIQPKDVCHLSSIYNTQWKCIRLEVYRFSVIQTRGTMRQYLSNCQLLCRRIVIERKYWFSKRLHTIEG